jgi:hypothetical protein
MRMKTNRFQNGSFDNAKERVGKARGLTVATPPRAKPEGSASCAAPARRAPRKRIAVSKEPLTTIEARIDVGFGNTLFIRGEGCGLSWEKGKPLTCVDGLTWIWTGSQTDEAVVFKLLLNDTHWCRGENMRAMPGKSVQVTPEF